VLGPGRQDPDQAFQTWLKESTAIDSAEMLPTYNTYQIRPPIMRGKGAGAFKVRADAASIMNLVSP
jgi:hypothetical protein